MTPGVATKLPSVNRVVTFVIQLHVHKNLTTPRLAGRLRRLLTIGFEVLEVRELGDLGFAVVTD